MTTAIQHAAEIISSAKAILINTGAGMGVDSGLPDFRGTKGFWQAYPPIAKLGLGFSEMANPAWFKKDPRLAWAFYGHRLNLYQHTKPHAGYANLLQIAKQKELGYFAFSSNVDGHLQQAGFADDRICEVHGAIAHWQCSVPCSEAIWKANIPVHVNEQQFIAEGDLPTCPHCGALARPNILMFGDYGWVGKRTNQQETRLLQWLETVGNKPLAVIELGAGLAVPTVRSFSESVVIRHQAKLIRINPRDTQLHVNGVAIPSGALEAISKIAELIAPNN